MYLQSSMNNNKEERRSGATGTGLGQEDLQLGSTNNEKKIGSDTQWLISKDFKVFRNIRKMRNVLKVWKHSDYITYISFGYTRSRVDSLIFVKIGFIFIP